MSDRIYLIEKRRKEAHTCHFGNDDTIDEIDRKRAAWSRYHHSLQAAYEAGELVPSHAAIAPVSIPAISPLHHLAKRGEQRTICDECGESELAHDRAVWTEDGSSFCPGCARRAAAPAVKVTLQDAARVLLAACPNPIFDDLKPVLIGEFSERIEVKNEDGDDESVCIPVSWTVTKEIISAALRALSQGGEDNG
ncbi:MAG: hypothetical protein GYB50_20480 [Rhodobacteraceae bacterium]|nr:hypothetical protein [Paracoccaceae bacterium]